MEKQKRSSCAGIWITLLCCAAITAGIIAAFSSVELRQSALKIFTQAITGYSGLTQTMPWFIILPLGLIALVILGIAVLPGLDRLTRRVPGGDALYSRIGFSFERFPVLRFVPAFSAAMYYAVVLFQSLLSFKRIEQESLSAQYEERLIEYGVTELIFAVIIVFSALAVIAEGIVNAGFPGMLLHIPLVAASNIAMAVFMISILNALVQSLIQLVLGVTVFIALGIFAAAKTGAHRKNTL